MMSALVAVAVVGSFALKLGDRVVFYGDSITEQQLYTVYVEAFVRTRYPDLDVRFYNRGVGGDASWGGYMGAPDERVRRDVKPLKPTMISIMLGMNDGCYYPFDQKTFDTVREWYGKLLGLMRAAAPSARLTLIRTSPWDDAAHTHEAWDPRNWHPWNGYNDVLVRYGKVVEDAAGMEKAVYVDFNKPVLEVLRGAESEDRELASQIIPDAIHPSAAGHIVMAGALLTAWGASATVADVRLDAAAKRVVSAENSKVDGFDGLTWTELDRALPFCVDPDNPVVKLVLAHCDFTETLNREMLKVRGLAGGEYELLVDGKSVAKFAGERLEQGVNLALCDTPMRKQALEVLELVSQRSEIALKGWRAVDVTAPKVSGSARARKSLYSLDDDMDAMIHKAAQPVPHRFELKRVL